MAETARYLYAVARGLPDTVTHGAVGVADAPVEALPHRGLVVLVSTVSLEEFGEDPLREHLEDMQWLERTARAHDDVVRLAADHGATAPLRMLTICRDDGAVRERLDEMYEQLTAALARVEGRREWSVKLILPPQPARMAAATAPVGGGTPGGAAYLRAKKEAAQARRNSEEAAARTAQHVYEALGQVAVASRRLPPQDPRLTGIPGAMTLNAAYLVEEADSERFTATVAQLAQEHPEVEARVDGPWPAYSFAMAEEP
jgi:hypothetical protein